MEPGPIVAFSPAKCSRRPCTKLVALPNAAGTVFKVCQTCRDNQAAYGRNASAKKKEEAAKLRAQHGSDVLLQCRRAGCIKIVAPPEPGKRPHTVCAHCQAREKARQVCVERQLQEGLAQAAEAKGEDKPIKCVQKTCPIIVEAPEPGKQPFKNCFQCREKARLNRRGKRVKKMEELAEEAAKPGVQSPECSNLRCKNLTTPAAPGERPHKTCDDCRGVRRSKRINKKEEAAKRAEADGRLACVMCYKPIEPPAAGETVFKSCLDCRIQDSARRTRVVKQEIASAVWVEAGEGVDPPMESPRQNPILSSFISDYGRRLIYRGITYYAVRCKACLQKHEAQLRGQQAGVGTTKEWQDRVWAGVDVCPGENELMQRHLIQCVVIRNSKELSQEAKAVLLAWDAQVGADNLASRQISGNIQDDAAHRPIRPLQHLAARLHMEPTPPQIPVLPIVMPQKPETAEGFALILANTLVNAAKDPRASHKFREGMRNSLARAVKQNPAHESSDGNPNPDEGWLVQDLTRRILLEVPKGSRLNGLDTNILDSGSEDGSDAPSEGEMSI
ncbi:hypothetical protein C8R43DRAFT_1135163 [Mycena crocata]|nr:hypothetical protein C8R43DRAFT_1135163 [Mycena crocata]